MDHESNLDAGGIVMDSLITPKTEKEKRAARLSCLLSVQRGTVPYNRAFGIEADIDAAIQAECQRAFALVVVQISKTIPGLRVTDGYWEAGLDGRAKLFVRCHDV